MKFISQEQFLNADEKVKEIICEWWQPAIGDIAINSCNEICVLDKDKLRQLAIMKKKGKVVIPLLTEGQLIDVIRDFAQMNIYTVDENWCIQLFEFDVAANDNTDCIYEASDKKLINVLFGALGWLAGEE